jgi:hypothetical protein
MALDPGARTITMRLPGPAGGRTNIRRHAHTLTARSCFKNWKQVSALNLQVSLDI